VKGPEMFLGYIQSDLNQDCFLDDGYFRTGDLAVIDKEFVTLEVKENHIGVVTVNRPPVNAINARAYQEIIESVF
jgi:long-subunit acyl-CoA synthetase (AMP-forming)